MGDDSNNRYWTESVMEIVYYLIGLLCFIYLLESIPDGCFAPRSKDYAASEAISPITQSAPPPAVNIYTWGTYQGVSVCVTRVMKFQWASTEWCVFFVDVQVMHALRENLTVTVDQFEVEDSFGNRYLSSSLSQPDFFKQCIPSGGYLAGTAQGRIHFQVPLDEPTMYLKYQPKHILDQPITVRLW